MTRPNLPNERERSLPAHLVLGMIAGYRRFVSPFLGSHCRFQPTCSAYAHEAIERHGLGRGSLLALRRLSRCHPIEWLGGSHGYDPVPRNAPGRVKAPHA